MPARNQVCASIVRRDEDKLVCGVACQPLEILDLSGIVSVWPWQNLLDVTGKARYGVTILFDKPHRYSTASETSHYAKGTIITSQNKCDWAVRLILRIPSVRSSSRNRHSYSEALLVDVTNKCGRGELDSRDKSHERSKAPRSGSAQEVQFLNGGFESTVKDWKTIDSLNAVYELPL